MLTDEQISKEWGEHFTTLSDVALRDFAQAIYELGRGDMLAEVKELRRVNFRESFDRELEELKP